MHQNNINKITCTKITCTKVTCTKMTLVKSLLKTINETSNLSNDNIFSWNVYNLSNSLPQVVYLHVLASLNRVPYISCNWWILCDWKKEMDGSVSNLNGRACNLWSGTVRPREVLIKQVVPNVGKERKVKSIWE